MSRYSGWDNKAVVMAQLRAQPKSKYKAKRVQIDNCWFDSKKEGQRYSELKMQQNAKLISNLTLHPVFPIWFNMIRICDVELDFAYDKDGGKIYEDVKGHDTEMSRLKRKLVEAFYKIKVEIL